MVKVKTFTTPIKVFHTMNELASLDEEVNKFLADNKIEKVVSISDTNTTDAKGATIGIVRAVTYEEFAS
ncbi:MAG: hypothetical protein CMM60_03845 [Rhodospirillaceae bacterium]|nr:hypothetical protein [Rhodospirillaceae bacterium]